LAFYVFTGKLGGGKSLCAVGRIRDCLARGGSVATNLDINLLPMTSANNKTARVMRIADKPSIEDFNALGWGNRSYDEEENWLLVLDECGTWFNSRNWNDKGRKDVNDWLLHCRKLGWDVILIIQDISILDSQARETLAEHTVFCKRTDRIQVPVIGGLYKAVTGYRLSPPRVHMAKCVYGTSPTDPVSDRWIYRGHDLFQCYDTKQLFLDDYEHGLHSLLTPWHTHGRYQIKKDWRYRMRITRIYLKRLQVVGALGVGSFFGLCVAAIAYTIVGGLEPTDTIALIEPSHISPGDVQISEPDSYAASMVESIEFFVGVVERDKVPKFMFSRIDGQIITSDGFNQLGITVVQRSNAATIMFRDITKTVYTRTVDVDEPESV